MTRLLINEVAPRDGLQMEKRFVPTHEKIAFVDALSDCGFAKIEVTSFTSARAIPALVDAGIVMREIRRVPGVVYTALVPNLRGMERAIESGVDELNLVMSCSESHNVANLRRGRADSLAQLLEIVREAGHGGVLCNVSLSCAFGCPFEGGASGQAFAAARTTCSRVASLIGRPSSSLKRCVAARSMQSRRSWNSKVSIGGATFPFATRSASR